MPEKWSRRLFTSYGYILLSHYSDIINFFAGTGFRAALYFNCHGYIQHLVIPKEQVVSYVPKQYDKDSL